MDQGSIRNAALGADERETLRRLIAVEKAKRRYRDFVSYVRPDYHWSAGHAYVAAKLQAFVGAVERKESPRLMLFLPPRWGKSELTSRSLPGWVLGGHPDWNVGIVSYGAELAEELSADARRVVLGDEYAEVFGRGYEPDPGSSVEIDRSSKAVNHWRIAGKRGGVRAVGVGGALTGRGFDICIIDDPIKGRKEADSDLVREDLWRWYQGTLRTRLEPGAGMLVINTRWHHDDLSGRLLRLSRDLWEVVALPAIAEDDDPLGREVGEALDPARFDLGELDAIRADISSRDWVAQYQQKPTPDEGSVFKREWFRVEPLDVRPVGHIIQSWDTAFTEKREADYSVCTTWRIYTSPSGMREYQLLDVSKGRWAYPQLKDRAIALAEVWRPKRIIFEQAASGFSLFQDLRNITGLPVVGFNPRKHGDKVARAHAITAVVEGGRVVLREGASWLEGYLSEMLQFPAGEHDDAVDSTTQALITGAIYNAPGTGRTRLIDFRFAAA